MAGMVILFLPGPWNQKIRQAAGVRFSAQASKATA
jgi:hypothetical protein